MKNKNSNILVKYFDFILIDIVVLMISFCCSYYFKFESFNMFEKQEWASLFIMICFVNLIVMFGVNPYRGIHKRRYYLQFEKEVKLFIYQIVFVCFIFYALKIGIIFSREMMFSMYLMYFILSQIIKYVYKKILNKEFEILKNIKSNNLLESNEKENKKIRVLLRKLIKRIIDIIAGIIGVIILVPLTIIVFILNRLNGEDGPVFYIQDRIGKNGKLFKMYKYRSMCIDADEKLEMFLEENEDIKKEFYIYRKIKNDPRITKLGKFLRRTSLDEFPQFINVLIGDMSLVRTKTIFGT